MPNAAYHIQDSFTSLIQHSFTSPTERNWTIDAYHIQHEDTGTTVWMCEGSLLMRFSVSPAQPTITIRQVVDRLNTDIPAGGEIYIVAPNCTRHDNVSEFQREISVIRLAEEIQQTEL